MTDLQQLDDQIAAMLEAGHTYEDIRRQLKVGHRRIRSIRVQRGIPLPPGRARRSRAELDALVPQVLAMLKAGATVKEIRKATLFGLNEIAALRRKHNIPAPIQDRGASTRRSIDDAFALYAKPTTTGDHLIWTGPRSGRGMDLLANGRTYNARAIAFLKHHGRNPEGRIRRKPTCRQPGCIAGAHHTDRRIRHARADQALEQTSGQDQ